MNPVFPGEELMNFAIKYPWVYLVCPQEGPVTAIQENSSVVPGQKLLCPYQLRSICRALWALTDEDLAGKAPDVGISLHLQLAPEMCRISGGRRSSPQQPVIYVLLFCYLVSEFVNLQEH